MIIDIHQNSGVPFFEQVVSQVIFTIASGALEPGSMIPSVREMASQADLNPNTVARAFQELERRGVVIPRRGKGMEIAPDAIDVCKTQRQDIIRNRVREALREAASSNLTEKEVRTLVKEELAQVNGQRKRNP